MEILVGCSSAEIERARDFDELRKVTKKLDVHMPSRRIYESPDELDGDSFMFPCIVRPTHSGGGSGIRLVHDIDAMKAAFPERMEDEEVSPRVVQDYVRGFDVSSSVLATGKTAIAISVQGQLIGMPTAGRNCGFAYCGNYLPSNLSRDVEDQIMKISEGVSERLGFKGSIGVDFVVDEKEEVWLLEVNPRIQGSLELIELAGQVSVTEMHVRAANGVLPAQRPILKAGVKMVIYSRRDGEVPNLADYPNTVDRTPKGVMVNLGDPICTIREVGSSLKKCYARASQTANSIQSGILRVDTDDTASE